MSLIEVRGLKKYFEAVGGMNHAVDDVSLTIEKGETLGVVGESGCGKSTLARTIIRLEQATEGEILFNGENITNAKGSKLKELRQRMQIIFQDPYSSLNPRMSIDKAIREPLINCHRYKGKNELDNEVQNLMDKVGIEKRLRNAYPHELDGGRRQRVGMARALAMNPEFIVCDEPVSALDVSIQAQVINLLIDLQKQQGLAYMFVTHDLSVVRHIADRICVMYLGQCIELCKTEELFTNTLHPYTKALLSAIPSIDILHPMKRIVMKGEITSPIEPEPGCRFAARCPYSREECNQPQKLVEVFPGHWVSCCRVKEINGLK